MKDIPIIFSGPLVRALLDGRKTMTRRILTANYLRIWTGGLDHGGRYVKPKAELFAAAMNNPRDWRMIDGRLCWVTDPAPHQRAAAMAQWMGRLPWSPGDRLWVRENWAPLDRLTHNDPGATAIANRGFYAADGGTVAGEISRWTPSIHMPRSASRLTLIVTGVKVERLQDISERDAQAEGIVEDDGSEPDIWYVPGSGGTDLGHKMNPLMADRPSKVFASLWRALHGAESWQDNPYVVALTFTVHKQNIDTLPKAEAA